ncbi:hypothetical protein ACLOJK_010161 [Asimina triloba]
MGFSDPANQRVDWQIKANQKHGSIHLLQIQLNKAENRHGRRISIISDRQLWLSNPSLSSPAATTVDDDASTNPDSVLSLTNEQQRSATSAPSKSGDPRQQRPPPPSDLTSGETGSNTPSATLTAAPSQTQIIANIHRQPLKSMTRWTSPSLLTNHQSSMACLIYTTVTRHFQSYKLERKQAEKASSELRKHHRSNKRAAVGSNDVGS